MVTWIYSIFVLLHGLAHMVYTAVARGWIPAPETSPNLTGNSWLLAGPLGANATRGIGSVVFTALTVAFSVAAIALGLRLPWAPAMLIISAVASSVALLAFWNGRLSDLTTQGLIGLIINLALLAGLYLFRFPALAK